MDQILAVRDLTIRLDTSAGSFNAVSELNLEVRPSEILAIVGESGSGKSLTALAVMRLLPEPPAHIAAGEILFGGLDLARASESALSAIRGNRIGMVFQEPMTSLNPSIQVGPQVAEALQLHKGLSRPQARLRVEELFTRVRIPDPSRRFNDYPHQMSGGMRQRVMISIAIACDPVLVVADEPTTALDVTTQAQILDIFRAFREEEGRSTILITHDLAVVAETADRVVVMYGGRVVESAAVEGLFDNPLHPYTRGLMASIPGVGGDLYGSQGRLSEIPGMVPPLWGLPAGCAFASRCTKSREQCRVGRPLLQEIAPGHHVACWYPGDAS